uniref:RH1 domain-containing protein n=1 Tax=Mesocestoides corti TaxID=53468 RepID=A0A5K3EW99_MESCO
MSPSLMSKVAYQWLGVGGVGHWYLQDGVYSFSLLPILSLQARKFRRTGSNVYSRCGHR